MASKPSSRPGHRLLALLGLVVVIAASAATTTFVACAAHEAAHAAVGTALGYEVVAIQVCPANASVRWAASDLPPIDSTIEAWAGGIGAAGVLAIVYLVAFVIPRRPQASAGWWAASLTLPALAAGELVIGILEGMSQGLYGAWIARDPALWIPVIGLSVAGGGAAHLLWLPGRRWGERPTRQMNRRSV